MEHITVIEKGDNLFELKPNSGYKLLDKTTQRTYSIAIVEESKVDNFVAVVEQ